MSIQFNMSGEKYVQYHNNNISIMDIEENKIVYSNEEITSYLKYSNKEIKETGDELMKKLMHPDDFEFYLKNTYVH